MIGSLGGVVFEVSSERVKTFQDLKFQYSMKYAQHDIHGGVGLLELTGRAPATCSLKILLDSALGVDPKDELKELLEIMLKGAAVGFILDGSPQALERGGQWVIESATETWKVVDHTGKMISAEVDLQLKEYMGDVK
jgi:phage protein U